MKGHLGTGLVQAKTYARQREDAVVVGAIPGICGSATYGRYDWTISRWEIRLYDPRKLKWWVRQDLNLEPADYEPDALTVELRTPMLLYRTFCAESCRASSSQLRLVRD